ncbi:UDP-N-acetylglucosamine pyrophosphorylase [Thermoflavimicrobium daqui]|uniref:UDP-N-acetylglucosamine pyrophosphorylase n=2 Tax=Thermoflavimicrobium daqui TaxID=2137476 RepID=A0A364K6X0_9BACL|nr:UDP-N-acetylglucosamine pyrophosphorylase [Thermoflavimicrobium daqui]
MKYKKIRNILLRYQQEHLLNHLSDLRPEEQEILLSQIDSIDFKQMENLYRQVENNLNNNTEEAVFNPLESVNWQELSNEMKDHCFELGMNLIKQGKVGVLVVAGGQGSRLGYEGPKGTYDIGLPSKKSLYQLQAERLLNLSNKANRVIPWYIMTSPENHEATVLFFELNSFFGYPQEDIFFFQQDVLPALDLNGKIVMKSPKEIYLVPNGNGCCFSALKRSGGLNDLNKRGIEWLFYYNIDNALIKVADPGFIGYSHMKGNPIASKFVEKRNPDEKVGVFGLKNGRPCVIEYTELPESMKYKQISTGQLMFNQANISVHLFHKDFIEEIADYDLPYRVARKNLNISNGNVDVFKFELFIFDLFPYADYMTSIQVIREEEFAPVKNKTGPDSPSTAKKLILDLHHKWLIQSGVPLEMIKGKSVEISPLLSYAGEGLSVELIKKYSNGLLILE